eukprot:Filipodium_phascolosomae@DN4890_c0_g1_i1.p1
MANSSLSRSLPATVRVIEPSFARSSSVAMTANHSRQLSSQSDRAAPLVVRDLQGSAIQLFAASGTFSSHPSSSSSEDPSEDASHNTDNDTSEAVSPTSSHESSLSETRSDSPDGSPTRPRSRTSVTVSAGSFSPRSQTSSMDGVSGGASFGILSASSMSPTASSHTSPDRSPAKSAILEAIFTPEEIFCHSLYLKKRRLPLGGPRNYAKLKTRTTMIRIS